MAGGTFFDQTRIRPGAYINFKSEGESLAAVSERGTVLLPILLPFGESKSIVPVQADSDFVSLFGENLESDSLLLVKEALKRAKTVLVYRMNGAAEASALVGGLEVNAKYPGTLGNRISVQVTEDPDDEDSFIVTTFLDGNAMDEQIISSVSQLSDNSLVTFSPSGDPLEADAALLSGGTDGTVTAQDYADLFSAAELYDFNTMALPVSDTTVKAAGIAFVKRMREIGKKIQLVLANQADADDEGVISVKNGVILGDGTVIDAVKATAWVAGATAGANVNQSLTYEKYDGAVDVDTRYSSAQIEEALQAGEFVFVRRNVGAAVEQDINTFVSFSANKGRHFSKNRVIRVLDSIGNDIEELFESRFAGKVSNNQDGRAYLKAECIRYFEKLQELEAIEDLNTAEDVTVEAGDSVDSVAVQLHIRPVDSLEKLYMTVYLR